jgi:two-component sensor histidine kinase
VTTPRKKIPARRARGDSRRQLEQQIEALRAQLEETRLALNRAEEELGWEQGVSAVLQDLYRPLVAADSSSRETARIVLDKARQLTGSACGFISTIEGNNGAPRQRLIVVDMGDGRREESSTLRRLLENPEASGGELVARALVTGEAFYANALPDIRLEFAGGAVAVRRFLAVPVKLDGKAVGQLALANPGRDYIERDLRLVKYLAKFYAMALQHKRGQERLFATLREKEVLLREIHHRVKNNLQVISSLLNLQAASLSDPQAAEMLKESQNRVRSMALVHDQLHRSPDLSRIGFREYVKNLCASLFSSYGVDSARIALRVDVEDIALPIDAAIPCGLIVHELVSNSLKHAFPGGRRGEIFIGLKSQPPRGTVLTVADNGIGLPKTIDLFTASSLGLRLVRILAGQIEAPVRHRSGAGTVFEIELPQRGGEEDYTDESTEDFDRRR